MGKKEKSVHSPKQRSYDDWPSSRFRDEKNPITETTSILSNKKQEKKTKKRKLPLKKKQQRSYDKWVKFRESNFKREALIK